LRVYYWFEKKYKNDNRHILFENYVLNLFRGENIAYWRTTAKAEVDFIVERKGTVVPVEVKLKPKVTRSLRSFVVP